MAPECGGSPLIVSGTASRRLKLLHGEEDSEDEAVTAYDQIISLKVGDLSAFPDTAWSGPDEEAASDDEEEGKQGLGDPLCTIGVAPETLLHFQVARMTMGDGFLTDLFVFSESKCAPEYYL